MDTSAFSEKEFLSCKASHYTQETSQSSLTYATFSLTTVEE